MWVGGNGEAVNLGIKRKKRSCGGSKREWILRKDMVNKIDSKQNEPTKSSKIKKITKYLGHISSLL